MNDPSPFQILAGYAWAKVNLANLQKRYAQTKSEARPGEISEAIKELGRARRLRNKLN